MTRTTHLSRRITVAIGLAATVAVSAVQPALAFDGRSPDTREAVQSRTLDARSPDTLEAAQDRSHDALIDARSPDTREARQDRGGQMLIDARSPDAREAAGPSLDRLLVRGVVDARSPDARDAAKPATLAFPTDAEQPIVSPDGFRWGDFGIGVGTAFAGILLLAGLTAGTLAARQRRGRTDSVTT